MVDPITTFGVAAGAVGIAEAAVHTVKILIEDIDKFGDAPATIRNLKTELQEVEKNLEILDKTSELELAKLGADIHEQSKSVIRSCNVTCKACHEDLKKLTRRSTGDKFSPLDKISVGIFKEHKIQAMTARIQACKSAFTCIVALITM